MKQNFQIGDVVQLKSGGSFMTVEGYDDKRPELVICVWHDKVKSYRETYHELTIEKDDTDYSITTI